MQCGLVLTSAIRSTPGFSLGHSCQPYQSHLLYDMLFKLGSTSRDVNKEKLCSEQDDFERV